MVWLPPEGMQGGGKVQSWLCCAEGALGRNCCLCCRPERPALAAVPFLTLRGVREMIFGVLRREKLQDQTFPWTSYNAGAFLAGGDEGVMSCLLLALGLQHSSGLDASALLTKWKKKYHFCSFERRFPSALRFPFPPERKPVLAFEALPMVQAGKCEAEPRAGAVGRQSFSMLPCPDHVSSSPLLSSAEQL